MITPDKIPQGLKKCPLWCNWKYEQREWEKKPRKVPYNPVNAIPGNQGNKDTYSGFECALSNLIIGKQGYDGIGFGVFGDPGAPSFIDIDNCIVNGVIDTLAQSVIDTMNSYTEISPSGKGVRIAFLSDTYSYDIKPFYISNQQFGYNANGEPMGMEVYTGSNKGHFVTITGNTLREGAEVAERGQQLKIIAEQYMRRPTQCAELPCDWQPQSPQMEDNKIIEIMLRSGSEKVNDLWAGNWQAYPEFEAQHQSGADQSLCNTIAFYTQNEEQMDRIFRLSGLYRDKWERQDYSTGTIRKAIAQQFGRGVFFGVTSAASDFSDVTESGNADWALIPASAVSYEQPDWLVNSYFLRGKLNLIQGDSGAGKTAFTMYLAACVSAGKPFCGIAVDKPCNVLILSVEDDPSTLRGRLDANGADLDRCYFPPENRVSELSFTHPFIESAIKKNNIGLIIFDPFQMFLSSKTDMFRANETRPILAKLAAMAKRNNCAVVIVAHTGKTSKDKAAVNRSLGSVDIVAAMRTALHIFRMPGNKEIVIAAPVKNNASKWGQAIKYTIRERAAVSFMGFEDFDVDELETMRQRAETKCPYDQEPFVITIRSIVNKYPGKELFSYDEVREEGYIALGGVPLCSSNDEISKMAKRLCKEINAHDGIEITAGAKFNSGKTRGLKIVVHRKPQA